MAPCHRASVAAVAGRAMPDDAVAPAEAKNKWVGPAITAGRLSVVLISLYMAVRIRLYAVITYGRVIHEFDPWFNYRATEYMAANGWDKFQVRARRCAHFNPRSK